MTVKKIVKKLAPPKKMTKQQHEKQSKKNSVAIQGLDVAEIEKAHAKDAAEVAHREATKTAAATAPKDKKTTRKRVDQVLKNDLVKVEVVDANIPIEFDHISVTAIEGLLDYKIPGTHLRLLCLADPTATPTLEQRTAMARRLLEVGPRLPRYIRTVKASPKLPPVVEPKVDLEQLKKDVGIGENHHPKDTSPVISRTGPVKKVVSEPKAPPLTDGVPLKKICSDVDIDPKLARRALRSAKIDKPGGRWEWPKDQVEKIKAILVKARDDEARSKL